MQNIKKKTTEKIVLHADQNACVRWCMSEGESSSALSFKVISYSYLILKKMNEPITDS